MKNIRIISVITVFTAFFTFMHCTREPISVTPSAQFVVDNEDALEAGKNVSFTITGTGDFFTIYTGDKGHNYDNIPQDKGYAVTGKTFSHLYNSGGTYKVVAIATSYGNWAEQSKKDIVTKEITVTDNRATFTSFEFTGLKLKGEIDNEAGTITFSMSSLTDRTSLVATFYTTSKEAKVYVNGTEQVSGTTANDFTGEVVYTVVAPSGVSKDYRVIINTFAPSSEKQLLTFSMANPEIPATIDEENKTVLLVAPFGTRLSSVRVFGTSSPKSIIKLKGKRIIERPRTINLSNSPEIISVIAEDLSVQEYVLTTILGEPFTSFTFSNLVPQPQAEIDHDAHTIQINVLAGTDVTQLVAAFTGNENAYTKIGDTEQISGVTVNDFTNPVVYTVTGKNDGVTVQYTVTVTIVP